MKLETNSERLERLLRERDTLGKPVEGRALPKGCQWTGRDHAGSRAAKRRLRQMEKRKTDG